LYSQIFSASLATLCYLSTRIITWSDLSVRRLDTSTGTNLNPDGTQSES
jgi:hypothetical protein